MACPISWVGTKTCIGLRALIQLVARAAKYLPAISHDTIEDGDGGADRADTEEGEEADAREEDGDSLDEVSSAELWQEPGVPTCEHEPEEFGEEECDSAFARDGKRVG